MNLYRFRSFDGRYRALTVDRNGERLPAEQYSWQFLGPERVDEQSVERLGLNAAEITAHVAKDGYLLLPSS